MKDNDIRPPSPNEAELTREPAQRADSTSEPAPADQLQPAIAPESSVSFDRELSATRDQLLRALADMDNMRKRTEREVASARAYGISSFARDLLGVADHMQRATHALHDELRVQADEPTKALLEGVELTQIELIKVLEKYGVKRIEPLGQKFDPNRHKAMKEVEDASVPAGNVVQVMEAGYELDDRLLRPALVAVAKTPAAASASTDENPTVSY